MRIFGWIAGGLSAAHNIPSLACVPSQVSQGYSAWAFTVRTMSLCFYILHGIWIEDLPLTAMSIFIMLQCVCLCMLKYWFATFDPPTTSSVHRSPARLRHRASHTPRTRLVLAACRVCGVAARGWSCLLARIRMGISGNST